MTYVYFAPLPDKDIGEPLLPEARWLAVKDIKNEKVKREKYFAWRLLEYGLCDALGLSLADAELAVSELGRWSSPFAYFSISHSEGALAVAISNSPCGIDIEPKDGRWGDELARRYFTAGELARYFALEADKKQEGFLGIWTAKEAVFKSLNKEHFSPADIDTSAHPFNSGEVKIGEKSFIYSIVSEGEITEKTIVL